MQHKIKRLADFKLKKTILIEGLPGIGNVGKVAVDFMIDNLNAKKIAKITSDSFPHVVFVNEKNLVELPSIEIYHKKIKGRDILFLSGDVQPTDEASCYDFCNKLLDFLEEFGCEEVITSGGIGLPKIPEKPRVYCTANSKKMFAKYKSPNLMNNVYGVVGPIIGVSGLLVGLSKERNIPSIALLAETYSHPTYLGIKGAREILIIINEKLGLGLDISQLDDEINELEKEFKEKMKRISYFSQKRWNNLPDLNYIG